MDDLDKKILDELQQDFPICAEPYSVVAGRLDISIDELFDRINRLTDDGTIRRIGASLDSRKLGCFSTLAAIKVSKADVEKACQIIDALDEITHSYLRNNEYNIWFTIIAPSEQRLKQTIETVKKKLALSDSDVLDLPVEKLFKLDARFKPSQ